VREIAEFANIDHEKEMLLDKTPVFVKLKNPRTLGQAKIEHLKKQK
jgi:hypothetical protein